MLLVWMTLAALALLTVEIHPAQAQVSASATIRARVRAAPRAPREPTSIAVPVDRSRPELARARVQSPDGASLVLEVEQRLGIERVSLLVPEPGTPSESVALECRTAETTAAAAPHSRRSTCDELVIRWPQWRDWPALLIIRADDGPGDPVVWSAVRLTLVVEY